jgi:hypothetical protein
LPGGSTTLVRSPLAVFLNARLLLLTPRMLQV